ncbi:MAG: ParA family protein [Microbacteriaceae bacterium]|jgi:chromosome partitioning protein|nr:ParA family protein [Microbacteriaceae bacterium]MBT5247602.1 ParA family protein [Microbacteriaceae bacterium]MBT7803092.1 ParA family protein [Microbacteriaceae bacterium]
MRVISLSSLKGGVGKTTVTLGLASAAFARGLRTLVVDMDPQSDASTGMDVTVGRHLNMSHLLAHPRGSQVRNAIVSSGWTRSHHGKVDVFLGSPATMAYDTPTLTKKEIWRVEEILATVEDDYDIVLIDCPPSINGLTRMAWTASDRVAVVSEPGLFSVAATQRAFRAVDELRRSVSPRLHPLGVIVNRVRPQSIEHQYRIDELKQMFGALVLQPELPERVAMQQAQGAASPLHVWPGESAEEMALNFNLLLDRVIRSVAVPGAESA